MSVDEQVGDLEVSVADSFLVKSVDSLQELENQRPCLGCTQARLGLLRPLNKLIGGILSILAAYVFAKSSASAVFHHQIYLNVS